MRGSLVSSGCKVLQNQGFLEFTHNAERGIKDALKGNEVSYANHA